MNKHTPGPWFSPDGKTIKQDFRPTGLTEAAGCIIGSVTGGPTSGPYFIEVAEEVAANTKLIAAAPDLLEALQDLTDDIAERFDMDSPSTNPGIKHCIDAARAAIAKATQ